VLGYRLPRASLAKLQVHSPKLEILRLLSSTRDTSTKDFYTSKSLFVGWLGFATWNGEDSTALRGV
jgi:hypothetical protein